MTDPLVAWLYDLSDAAAWTVSILEAGLLGNEETMAKKIRSYFPVTMTIDDEAVMVHIRRMSTVDIEEFESSMRGFGYKFDGSGVDADASQVDGKKVAAWLLDVIGKYVSVPKGELTVEGEDGLEQDVLTGADLVAQFGGRVDFIPNLVAFIWGENRLPEKRKGLFRDVAAKAVARATRGIVDAPEPPAPKPIVSEADEKTPSVM